MPKLIHFPQTTVEQRMQLFNLWEVTGSVTTACATLELSRATFYYWKAAFVNGGYHALQAEQPVPETQRDALPKLLADEILALKAAHPHWGTWQILHALKLTYPCAEHVSVDTVAYVLSSVAQL